MTVLVVVTGFGQANFVATIRLVVDLIKVLVLLAMKLMPVSMK